MGIELFRIVSMLMVVWLHILGHGGVLSSVEFLSTNYYAARFLEAIVYCSVNCYALISGYANVGAEFKLRRFVYLWLETVVLITVLNLAVHFLVPSVTVTADWWIAGFFPLTMRELWYLCAYFFMYPFIPILNRGLAALSRRQHLLVIFLTQMPTWFRLIVHTDNYALGGGYSAMWLICLYVIGAYFRFYGAPRRAKPYVTLPIFFLSAAIATARWVVPELLYAKGILPETSVWYAEREIYVSYISPFMVIMGVMLLLFFMQITIRREPLKWLTLGLGKATWGVFVLHVSSAFWYCRDFWSGFSEFGTYGVAKMILAILGTGILMYFGFSLVSLGCIYLFKVLKIPPLMDSFADLINKKVDTKSPRS